MGFFSACVPVVWSLSFNFKHFYRYPSLFILYVYSYWQSFLLFTPVTLGLPAILLLSIDESHYCMIATLHYSMITLPYNYSYHVSQKVLGACWLILFCLRSLVSCFLAILIMALFFRNVVLMTLELVVMFWATFYLTVSWHESYVMLTEVWKSNRLKAIIMLMVRWFHGFNHITHFIRSLWYGTSFQAPIYARMFHAL